MMKRVIARLKELFGRKPTNQPDKTSRDPNLAALKKKAAEQGDRFKLKQKPKK
jgi:hypothetical protein